MVNLKTALCGVALIGATALITANVVMADPTTPTTKQMVDQTKKTATDAMDKMKKDAQDMMGGDSAEMQEMMQKMAAFGTPGPEHKMLSTWEGNWTAKVTMWMAEGAPPMESTGSSTCKAIFGGRYIQEKFNGNMMGEPFEGMAISGFNNGTKEFFSFWIDSMGTGYMIDNGTMDSSNKVLTSEGSSFCPVREKMIAMENKITIIDANTRKMEMFAPDMKTNNMFKNMEIVYTRAK